MALDHQLCSGVFVGQRLGHRVRWHDVARRVGHVARLVDVEVSTESTFGQAGSSSGSRALARLPLPLLAEWRGQVVRPALVAKRPVVDEVLTAIVDACVATEPVAVALAVGRQALVLPFSLQILVDEDVAAFDDGLAYLVVLVLVWVRQD